MVVLLNPLSMDWEWGHRWVHFPGDQFSFPTALDATGVKIYYYQNEETHGGKTYGWRVGTISTLPLDSLKLLELSENNSFHFLSLSSQNFYHHSPELFLFVLISMADKFLHHSKDNPFIFALNLGSLLPSESCSLNCLYGRSNIAANSLLILSLRGDTKFLSSWI